MIEKMISIGGQKGGEGFQQDEHARGGGEKHGDEMMMRRHIT